MFRYFIHSVHRTNLVRSVIMCAALAVMSQFLIGGCGGGGSSSGGGNAAPNLDAQTFATSETSKNGTVLGQIVASDPEGQTLTYTTSDSLPFSLASDGTITVTDETSLDFETTPSYTMNVAVSDGINTTNAQMAINLDDVESETTEGTVIPTDVANIESVSLDGTQVTFTNPDSLTDSLAANSILLVPTCTAAPDGLLKKVVSKQEIGGKVVLTVEDATIEDAFEELDLDIDKPITFENLDESSLPAGISVENYAPAPPTQGTAVTTLDQEVRLYNGVVEAQAASSAALTFKRFSFANVIIYEEEGTDNKVTVSGSLILQMSFVLDTDISRRSLSYMDIKAVGTAAAQLSLNATADIASYRFTFVKLPLPAIPVGPLLVVPEVELAFKASASAGLSYGAGASVTFEAGSRYVKGVEGLEPYFSCTPATNTPSLLPDLQVSAELGLEINVSAKLFNFVGPYVTKTLYLGVYAPGLGDVPGVESDEIVDLHFGSKVRVGLKAKLWKFINLDLGEEFTLFDVEIWDYSALEAQIETVSAVAVEDGDDGIFRIFLNQAPSSDLTIVYSPGGSAHNGSDYDHISGTVIIPAGKMEATVTINAEGDSVEDSPESVILTLIDADGYRLGSSTEATVTITEDTGGGSETITVSYPTSTTTWTEEQTSTYVEWSGATTQVRCEIYKSSSLMGEYHGFTANDGHVNRTLALDSNWTAASDYIIKVIDENGNWGWSSEFTIETSGGSVAFGPGNWTRVLYPQGDWGIEDGKLKVNGYAYREGGSLQLDQTIDFREKVIRIVWSVDGNNAYTGANFFIGTDQRETTLVRPFIMTTDHSFLGSTVISHNQTYYTIFRLNSDQTYSADISTNDFSDNGGTVFHSTSDTVSDWSALNGAYFQFGIGDNYGGTGASMSIHQIDIQ